MFEKILAFILLPLLIATALHAQEKTGRITGIVKNDTGKGLELVTVAVAGTSIATITNQDGKYSLTVPADRQLVIVFSAEFGNYVAKKITVPAGATLPLYAEIKDNEMAGVLVRAKNNDITTLQINASDLQGLAGPQGGIEGLIKILVGTNNEMTSQYAVRGGNYDENLVYVNDFEIYRPFLTRSGQQEGLSFVNPDLVSGVSFSLGGFQARYGDKMSSVLDVTYKRPKHFGGSVTASLLGAAVHLEGHSYNDKFTYLVGLRQKSNQYLLQSQPTKGVYNPSFTDFQMLMNYRFSKKWEVELIGNYARNRFTFFPESQTSSFGVINKAYQLRVFYTGSEIDQFDSRFGGVSITHHPNEKLSLKLLTSAFQSDERETYDINGEYLLGELETDLGKENFGQIKTYLGTGVIQNYARNYLTVTVGNVAHRGSYKAGRHFIQWGLDANIVNINDKLHEYERRDSAGYTQPFHNDSLTMMKLYSTSTALNYVRYSGFVQDNFRFSDSLDLFISAGVRFNSSTLNGETVVSPRVQLSYKPKWKKNDILFKLAAGLYAQPPLYREMRDLDGNVNTNLKAQKSTHYVLGADYNFRAGKRPIKLTAEVYYKKMTDLVPYEYDNVRIRYFGKNDAIGYAYGGEVRLYGDLVQGAPSWLSIGMMKTMEDVTDDKIEIPKVGGGDSLTIYPGYVPRPTDQRLMFGMYFQDYLPRNKNFRMHLNLLYATGLPFGPPDKQRYGDTLRLPDYKRVDVGFSALLLDAAKKKDRPYHSFFRQINSIWASLEVFNLLGIQNTLSYTWIQDQTSGKIYAVPNRLTSRLINVKMVFNF